MIIFTNLNKHFMRKLFLSIMCVACSFGYESVASEPIVGEGNPKPNSENIVFADAVVKRVCVSAFDTNCDGELSYEEAAKVTSIPSKFFGEDAENITTFNELQYFTNLQVIKDSAFFRSNLSQIIIPEGVTHIGAHAFSSTDIVSIIIPDSVTTMGDGVFECCFSLTNIVLSNNLLLIPSNAFRRTNLFSVTIPDGTTSIGSSAFEGCDVLTEITIPDSITSIENYAFSNCSNLKTIYCKVATPPVLYNVGYGHGYFINNDISSLGREKRHFTIYVPQESVSAYKKDRNWKQYSKTIEGYDFK